MFQRRISFSNFTRMEKLSKSLKQTQNAEIKIIISHHEQIVAMCTTEFAMLPIPNSEMSPEAINRMHLKNIYSANVFCWQSWKCHCGIWLKDYHYRPKSRARVRNGYWYTRDMYNFVHSCRSTKPALDRNGRWKPVYRKIPSIIIWFQLEAWLGNKVNLNVYTAKMWLYGIQWHTFIEFFKCVFIISCD